jgi:hypothetical protein
MAEDIVNNEIDTIDNSYKDSKKVLQEKCFLDRQPELSFEIDDEPLKTVPRHGRIIKQKKGKMERKKEWKKEKTREKMKEKNAVRFQIKNLQLLPYQFQKPKNKIFLELIIWKVKHDGKNRSNYGFRSASRVVINDFSINQVRFYDNSSWNFE